MKDQRCALILRTAQTQHWNMRSHVAIPLRMRQNPGIFFSASSLESGGDSRMLPLLHQTYRKGNHLVYESSYVKYICIYTYVYDSKCWSG